MSKPETVLTDESLLERMFKRYGLTYAQMDAARLVLHGLTNAQIAEQLGVQEKTIKFHISDVYKRTRTSSRAQFIIKFQHEYMSEKLRAELNAVFERSKAEYEILLRSETARLQACRDELNMYKSSAISKAELVSIWPKFVESMNFCTGLKQIEVRQKSLELLLTHLNLN